MLRVAMITDHADDEHKVDGGVQAVTKNLVSELIRHSELELHVLTFDYAISESSTTEQDGYTKHILPGARLFLEAYLKYSVEELIQCCTVPPAFHVGLAQS